MNIRYLGIELSSGDDEEKPNKYTRTRHIEIMARARECIRKSRELRRSWSEPVDIYAELIDEPKEIKGGD